MLAIIRRIIPGHPLGRSELTLMILSWVWSLVSLPTAVLAECGVTDIGACADSAEYSIWMGLAKNLWLFNRVLLALAYQLDQLRWWLIDVAFTTVYQTLVETIEPGLVPFATLAIMIGICAFLVTPVFGKINIVNIRRVVVWTLVAPIVLTLSGQWLAEVERFRSDVGGILFNAAAQVAPGAIFGAPADDMPQPTELYNPPVGVCGGAPLQRPQFGSSPATGYLQMDDMAASMMYANAQDIHCPAREGPSMDIPDGFYSTPKPNYAVDSIDDYDAPRRKEAINNIQRGVSQLGLGIIPSILAVLDKLIHLIFTVAEVAVWISLPIGLLFVFFNDTAGSVQSLFRRIVGVIQASWSSSLLLGLLFAAILSAGQMGSTAAYTGLTIAGIFACLYVIWSAGSLLGSSLKSIGQTFGTATGMGDAQQFTTAAAGMLIGGGAGAIAGGLKMAQTYSVAQRESGSRRYAAGAALGRLRSVSRMGEVAASMGYSSELTDGIYTGRRSTKAHDGWRSVQRAARSDGDKSVETADGRRVPMREHAKERAVARQVQDASRGSTFEQSMRAWQRVGRGAAAVMSMPGRIGEAVESGATGRVVAGAVRQRLQAGSNAIRTSITDRAGEHANTRRRIGSVVRAASSGFQRDRSVMQMSYNPQTKRIDYTDRVPDDQLPESATTEQANNQQIAQWLLDQRSVQRNADGTATHWDRSAEPRSRFVEANSEPEVITARSPVTEAQAQIAFEEAKQRRQARQTRDLEFSNMLNTLDNDERRARFQRSRQELRASQGSRTNTHPAKRRANQAVPAISYIDKQRHTRSQLKQQHEQQQRHERAARFAAVRQKAVDRSAQSKKTTRKRIRPSGR